MCASAGQHEKLRRSPATSGKGWGQELGGRGGGGGSDDLSYWTRRARRCFHLCGGAGTRSGWIGAEREEGNGGAG